MNKQRFIIEKANVTQLHCFDFTVIDTTTNEMICGTFDETDADKVCMALNAFYQTEEMWDAIHSVEGESFPVNITLDTAEDYCVNVAEGKCESCGINEEEELHPCPYQEDINNDSDTLCNCCGDCSQQCAWDI